MVNDNSLTVSLEEFGLSKYEARAYVTLITKGTISASELAYYSELPRTKVYPILLKLEKKKLAIISKSKPIMCTAIAPEDAFDDVVQDQINKVNAMNTLVSKLKKISEESKKSRGAEEKRYFNLNAVSVLNQLKIMIEGSKSSINIIVDQWGLGLLAECKEQLVSVLRRNIEIKIIISPSSIGSESIKKIPDGVKIRISDIIQNCFVFDKTELMLIDSDDGKGATFSSTEIMCANQIKLFSQVWKIALKNYSLSDMTKVEAQEIYRIIRLISESALSHVLNSIIVSKIPEIDMIKFLEKNGINLKSKSLLEIIDIVNCSLQIVCAGKADLDEGTKNITIESKMNSGHSLPWAAIVTGYLQNHGYKPRLIYQNLSQKGEKIHIKISS
ncbi:MAG: TrmB family transcriptional regulator [Nitrosopumilales archaeon]|nr:MAG: TrmB family transcriptional regulator [Nitrosopumilales archaeon]